MKESIEVDTNGQVSKLEVDLDLVAGMEDHATSVTFSSPADGSRKVFVTFPKFDFEELGSPNKVTLAVSAA